MLVLPFKEQVHILGLLREQVGREQAQAIILI